MIDFLVLAAIGGAWLIYRHLPPPAADLVGRQLLEAERDKLIADNDAAPGWGAAVGARLERIKEINALLAGDM